ncbi:SDR family NAD(P)-dependent oxidoreductase [Metabacillus rhizolycopersici]|uniref:SDR family NAD(P)-dependent oxidoreductase n=1 Tax=Metabacillus rhizolycopersici TaxID=2875709 RepID=A0ABS7UQP0_9BACI|nr:SDR family NAD(P)-dependent oxidoreductase [Metabacillus rhizolycopersici]MBZ5750616.1 SDR family NAD(P)-dependent oxidoreductase [Metabacillus rhizolycopersici]
MSKIMLITNCQHQLNQLIGEYYLKRNYKVIFYFENEDVLKDYENKIVQLGISSDNYMLISNDKIDFQSLEKDIDIISDRFGQIDILIHGNEMLDETKYFLEDPVGLEQSIEKIFGTIYLFNRVITSRMIKSKEGKIIFPLIFDVLYHMNYPSSPILNGGKISLMKCMSSELSAFKLNVNAITFGYYDNEFDSVTKKELKKKLEIFALRPRLLKLQELIPALNILVEPPVSTIGGENIHIGAGIETVI